MNDHSEGETRRKHEKWEGFDGSSTIGRLGIVRGRRRRLARPRKRGERRIVAANPEALTDRGEGEETKAARPSLSHLAISDPSHLSGELQWSTRPKKDVGRSSDVALRLSDGRGHLARWSKASGNKSSDGGVLAMVLDRRRGTNLLWFTKRRATSELIKANLELTLEKYRPMVLSYLSFSKFTLGTVAPQFIGVSTVDDGGEGINMELEMNWDRNPRLEGLDVGLTSVLESMEFCLELRGSEACALEDFTKVINLVHLRKDLVESGHVLLNHAYHN
ncbi:unnamed protein product [Lactuca saligna]|uniref:Uncharacterized protein n=1 Tax=Lactuca saligna TaxID=75948 RepID=A0AA35UJT2_LACSI|nr:unnamed protein product [Lactuca saligna]